ncbi:MAG: PrsW family intramembrane metalloprotease [Thermoplasmata archaeon]
MDNSMLVILAILLGSAFIPSLCYLLWVRNSEKHDRIAWSSIFLLFMWGAVFAVIMAIILSFLFVGVLSLETLQQEYIFLQRLQDPTMMTLVMVCVIAPIVEEFTKAMGVVYFKGRIFELEDGLILGAASGLGFAATENLLYGSSAYIQYGFQAFVMVIVIRSIASTLLHGSASAVAGYGISKGMMYKKHYAVPYYLVAVVMHGSFNYLASIGMFYGGDIPLIALAAAVMFSLISFKLVRGKIKELDRNVTLRR